MKKLAKATKIALVFMLLIVIMPLVSMWAVITAVLDHIIEEN
jgi:hypothetical protein